VPALPLPLGNKSTLDGLGGLKAELMKCFSLDALPSDWNWYDVDDDSEPVLGLGSSCSEFVHIFWQPKVRTLTAGKGYEDPASLSQAPKCTPEHEKRV
jgi:hypothetical protein